MNLKEKINTLELSDERKQVFLAECVRVFQLNNQVNIYFYNIVHYAYFTPLLHSFRLLAV